MGKKMENRNYRNQYGVKNSCDMYRNIKGVRYEQATADSSQFETVKLEAKNKGLKTRMIVGEMFIEVKKNNYQPNQ